MITLWNQLYLLSLPILLPYGDSPNTSDTSFPTVYKTEDDTSRNEPLIEKTRGSTDVVNQMMNQRIQLITRTTELNSVPDNFYSTI